MRKLKIGSILLAGILGLNLLAGACVPAQAAGAGSIYPTVQSYETTSGEFSLAEDARICVAASSRTLHNTDLEDDLKLMSSEYNAKSLTSASMDIIFGAESAAKPGDIVVAMEDIQETDNAEGYKIEIGDYAKVTAPNEDGIFYGMRTIQKALLANDGKMDKGTIVDYPAVSARGIHMDVARKFYTKDWIIAMVKDLSYQNFNFIQFHFSENEGYRLESSTLEKIQGFQYPSDGYLTKQDMLEIIDVCNQYHIELVPSLDSPGHMNYVLKYLPSEYNCTSLFPTDDRRAQTFNIFENENAKKVLTDLFEEYAKFFSEAGCRHMNIGGDEFLAKFTSMTNDQYITVMNYFNEISGIVKKYGITPRAWNDGLLLSGYTGYELDPDIEICYWEAPGTCASYQDFVENGNKVINMHDTYMYFVLSPWWMQYVNAVGEKIYKEWTPGNLPSYSGGAQSVTYPYEESLLGGCYALWCDLPYYMDQNSVASELFLRTRAMAERSWKPDGTAEYSSFEALVNKLGRVAGYDANLPEPGEVSYPTDKSALEKAVDDAKALKEADYTTKTWKDFTSALAAAQAVLSDEKAAQEKVDAALAELTAKQEALKQVSQSQGDMKYNDVKKGDWYYNYVEDVYAKKLMTGLSDDTFGPADTLVRAQFATILYRMEGQPKVAYSDKFKDVPAGQFFTSPVMWAAADDVRVVTGYSNGNFGPNDKITREQMALMMYRYAKYKGYDISERADLGVFPDQDQVSSYARDAVQWCVAKGLISGQDKNGAKMLNPQGDTSRAECATIISRYANLK